MCVLLHLCTIYIQTKIRRLSVWMAMASFAHIFNGMLPFFTLCMYICEQFQMFWHSFPELFRWERVSIHFNFNFRSLYVCPNSRFHYSTILQHLLGNLCVFVCECVFCSLDGYIRFCTHKLFHLFRFYILPIHTFSNGLLLDAVYVSTVHVMHLYV